jgi:hypothetical protein
MALFTASLSIFCMASDRRWKASFIFSFLIDCMRSEISCIFCSSSGLIIVWSCALFIDSS